MITSIGEHRVRHGDLMDGLADLMGGKKADFIYTDPPWGQGTLKYWQTKNQKDTGAEPQEVDHEKFLDAVFSTISELAAGPVIVEYGMKWRDEVALMGNKNGLQHRGCTMIHYKSGSELRPCDLHLFSHRQEDVLTPAFGNEVEGLFDFKIVDLCFQHYAPKSGIVLDPMCGLGSTAKAAVKYGLTFYGNELNKKRLGETIKLLEKAEK